MAEQVIYFSNNVRNYSKNIKKLIDDISEELSKGVKDGLASRISSVENDEAKLYSFVKNEGYAISYKEFSGFIADCKKRLKLMNNLLIKLQVNKEAKNFVIVI